MPEIHGTENAKKFSIGSALFIVSIKQGVWSEEQRALAVSFACCNYGLTY